MPERACGFDSRLRHHVIMNLIKHGLAFSIGTLISRVLGYVRDATIAYFFGSSRVTDAFFIAFRIPNTLRRLLGEGGFNAAFIPIYAKVMKENREKEFLSSVFTYYTLISLFVTLLGIAFAPWVVSIIAPGIKGRDYYELTVFFTRWVFSYLFFIGLSSFFMGVLNVRGVFFIPAFAQAVYNFAFSLIVATTTHMFGYVSLIVGTLVGGFLQLMVHLPYLFTKKVKLGVSFKLYEEEKELLKRLGPALLGFGVAQLSFFIDTFLASFLKVGSVSYLYYANRIFQLPLGAVSVGMANSLLSALSLGEDKKSRTTLAVRFIVIISLPASLGMMLISEEIVSLLYGRGRFTPEDVHTTAKVLSAYSLGLLFFSLQKLLSATFFAEGDTKTPVKSLTISILVEGLSASIYAFVLGMGVVGLALGTSTSSLAGFVYLLGKRKRGYIEFREVISSIYKSAVACGLMAAFLYVFHFHTLLRILTAALVYFLTLLLLREDMLVSLLKKLWR